MLYASGIEQPIPFLYSPFLFPFLLLSFPLSFPLLSFPLSFPLLSFPRALLRAKDLSPFCLSFTMGNDLINPKP